jgi:tRNA A64-2'-O-ribosylphosphate transferase
VDSTRRGKRMPDALSKTVPIWCATMNRAVGFEGQWESVEVPMESVSPQEKVQINAMLSGFVHAFKVSV